MLPSLPTGTSDLRASPRYLAAVLFLTLSIFSLALRLSAADQQSQLETISIDATGQATAIGNGPSGTTTLKMTAQAYKNSNGWLMIQNTTGALQIGGTDFTITGGHGSVSAAGAIAIFANTPIGVGQLILQGTMTGNAVTFDMPSQLATESYLSLSGNLNNAQETTIPTVSVSSVMSSTSRVENVTSAATSANETEPANSTSTVLSSVPHNAATRTTNATLTTTLTTSTFVVTSSSLIENSTTSSSNETERLTVTIQVIEGEGEICLSSQEQMPLCTNTTQTATVNAGELVNFDATADNGFTWGHYDGLGLGQAENFNAVITQNNAIGVYFAPLSTSNANVTSAISLSNAVTTISVTTMSSSQDSTTSTPIPTTAPPAQGDVTVTVTQYVNQTVSVTQTAAYTTVSYTVTTTVANTTVAQGNMTSSVNETTIASTTSS